MVADLPRRAGRAGVTCAIAPWAERQNSDGAPRGQSLYETGTTPTIARNASQTNPLVVRATNIVPNGVPTRRDVPASHIPVC